jgi:small subunit ribosomal protein S3
MSHTVHPYAHRLGIIRDWKSRWFALGDAYKERLKGDVLLREYLEKRLRGLYVSSIEMERGAHTLRVIVKTTRPGLLIGRSGEGAARLRADIVDFLKRRKVLESAGDIKLDIEEVRSPESNAKIVGFMAVEGLEKRLPFRRVLKQLAEKVMANRDVLGVRIKLSGRLGGADMARQEEIRKGRIPLQTFRSDIDFARLRATIPQGDIGVKVWIYRGEVFQK